MDAYRDQYATVFNGGKDVVLLAISADPVESLASWAKDKDYPFTFLSDGDGAVGRKYGAYLESMKLDNRTLYVIDPKGTITYVTAPFRQVDPTAYTELEAAVKQAGGAK